MHGTRDRVERRWILAAGLLALILTGALATPAPLTGQEPQGREAEGMELRPAREPSPREQARMARWHERWDRETAPLERLLGPLSVPLEGVPVGDADWCRALAEALLGLDRARAFPVPLYAADSHLRRAVQRLVLGATACLRGRFYEAAHRIRQAEESFASAELVLRPYGLTP